MLWIQLVWQTAFGTPVLSRIARLARGQSTVEYALVGALVVIAAAAALTVLGDQVTAVFGNISNTLKTAGPR
ncbi:MAG: Flp family type IVb pilin [Chloroflexota bacterium]|nr:Flp family type IVb pilin [Chloroflexota bacterium]